MNGVELTEGQAMAFRVAVTTFHNMMVTEGLGHDIHGRRMSHAYKTRLDEILELIITGGRRRRG